MALEVGVREVLGGARRGTDARIFLRRVGVVDTGGLQRLQEQDAHSDCGYAEDGAEDGFPPPPSGSAAAGPRGSARVSRGAVGGSGVGRIEGRALFHVKHVPSLRVRWSPAEPRQPERRQCDRRHRRASDERPAACRAVRGFPQATRVRRRTTGSRPDARAHRLYGTGEQTLGEVGDFRDVRVPTRVGRRCHARPPPPFTAAGSFGPASLCPDAGGTDVPGVRFLPTLSSVLSPASPRR